jgi:hypothetical protein
MGDFNILKTVGELQFGPNLSFKGIISQIFFRGTVPLMIHVEKMYHNK